MGGTSNTLRIRLTSSPERPLQTDGHCTAANDDMLDMNCEESKRLEWRHPREGWDVQSLATTSLKVVVIFSLLVSVLVAVQISLASAQDDSSRDCPVKEWSYPWCEKFPSTPTLRSSKDWMPFRRLYHEIVGEEASSMHPSWEGESSTGFYVGVDVREVIPGVKGAILTEDVAKRTIVWDNRYSIRLPNECAVRQFLSRLSEKDQCAVLTWAYINDHYGQGMQLTMDTDSSSYRNHAFAEHAKNLVCEFLQGDNADESLGFVRRIQNDAYGERRRPGSFVCRATKDIAAGSELLLDYRDIHSYVNVWWFHRLEFRTRRFWSFLFL